MKSEDLPNPYESPCESDSDPVDEAKAPESREHLDDVVDRVASIVLASLVAGFAVLPIAWFVFPTTSTYVQVVVAMLGGILGAAPGENLLEAIIRTLIIAGIAAGIWYFFGYEHWIVHLILALQAGFCVGGLTYGFFRAIRQR